MPSSARPLFDDRYWLRCRPCDKILQGRSSLQQHHDSTKHQKKTDPQPYDRYCSTCNTLISWALKGCTKCHPSQQTPPQQSQQRTNARPTHSGSIILDAACRVVCLSCSTTRFFNAHSYAQHSYSPGHQEKLEELRAQTNSLTAQLPVAYRCLCSPKHFQAFEDYKQHAQTKNHAKRMRAKSLVDKMSKDSPPQQPSAAPRATAGDSANIWLDPKSLDFGYAERGKEHKKIISLVNRGKKHARLINALMMPRSGWGATFFEVEGPRSAELAPAGKVDYTLLFTPKHTGYYEQCIIFRFEDGKEIVGCMTGAVSINPSGLETLAPTSPYKKKTAKDDFMRNREVIRADVVIARGPAPKLKHLGQYNIPAQLASTLRLSVDDALAVLHKQIKLPVTKECYVQAMTTMLHAEEAAMKIDIQQYDLHGVALKQTPNKRYFLDVPGLAEGRPSVIRNDTVSVVLSNGQRSNDKAYEGVVMEVHLDRILIEFHRAFNSIYSDSQRFDVRFSFNRQPLRRMHAAVNQDTIKRFAFPAVKASSSLPDNEFAAVCTRANGLDCINPMLATNLEQKLAVSIILENLHGNTPFVLFGPPGTGKTVTLVETILQLRRRATQTGEYLRILVCTPSNSSADWILDRLHAADVTKEEMQRINSPSRSTYTMPMAPHLEQYCFRDRENNYGFPPVENISKVKILVMTNIAAGFLARLGDPKPLTHIFLDEAGQCVEPETLVPLQLAQSTTSIVLTGDHKQLGPVVRSPVAIGLGLNISMLERLICLPPEVTPYPWCQSPSKRANIFGVKLLTNYRAHPDLISVPNRLFYNSELHSEAPKRTTDMFLEWPGLPQPNYPVKFIGVEGMDEREGNSPSWFNRFEAETVVNEIISVLDYTPPLRRGPKIKSREIGVIVPYRKQVEKIRQLLKKNKVSSYEDIKVDTVERFQGLERPVMVVSTVRSQTQWADFDAKFNLGFVNNPKRFNVAVTRARALLIIVGNPNVLVQDEHWAAQIREIAQRGGAVGAQVPMHDLDDEVLINELVRLADALYLDQAEEGEEGSEDDSKDGRLSNEDSWSTSVQDYLSTATASAEEDGRSDDSDDSSANFQLI